MILPTLVHALTDTRFHESYGAGRLASQHRRGFAPVHFPLEDRSLKIVPAMSRLRNKKPQLGAETYRKAVTGSAQAVSSYTGAKSKL
jgi:hypothetical protein